jgi:hypothetical protein
MVLLCSVKQRTCDGCLQRKKRQEKERDYRYTAVMRALVWRYVSAKHHEAEENPVTEDDINEVKGEISAAKCELLEVLRSNGMDISKANPKEKSKLQHIFSLHFTFCDCSSTFRLSKWVILSYKPVSSSFPDKTQKSVYPADLFDYY